MIYDNVIMRTIVELPDEQIKALTALCEAEGISRAEAIRRALADMLAKSHAGTRQQAFGSWDRKGDSRQLVEALRQEWER